MRLAIIGAGISGLACADMLAANGTDVTLFDKSRGVGGRMATRRIEAQTDVVALDHGAQYFTARTPSFRAQVAAWEALGLAARWPEAGIDAWVGTPTMTAPVKHIADRHKVELRRHVHRLWRHDRKWWLQDQGDTTGPFDGIVVALPAEQTLPFLGMHDLSMARAAIAARTQPCWTTMAVFERHLDIASDLMRDRGLIARACRNNAKPGRSVPEAWVVQASAALSTANLDLGPQNVAEMMLDALLSESRDTQRPVATSLIRASLAIRDDAWH